MQLALRLITATAFFMQAAAVASAQGASPSRLKGKTAFAREGIQSTQAVTSPPSSPGNVAQLYQCENGARLFVTFPRKIALITSGEDTYRLKSAASTSGTKYAAGPVSFETQKNGAVFDQHGAVTKCRRLP